MRRSIIPGELWLDTSGKPIQAHGGSMIIVDNVFYWYGENKEFTTGKSEVWTWGVRCYRSTDLYNWEDLGLIIPPDLKDPSSPLSPRRYLDRPHIIHNKRTGKFVCWLKILNGPVQTRTVLVADAITGPYRIVRKDIEPLGMGAGDFDLVASPDDGKAYMYFERVHSEMICADLTSDYTDFTGFYSTHFPAPGPPSVREAPAYFQRRDSHYLATSGTTGYFPNPSEVAVARTYHGPWTKLGDLHPDDRSRTSFNSQISCIFRHPGKKDLYIAMADRWMGPRDDAAFESGDRSRLVQRAFAKSFADPPQSMTAEEKQARNVEGGLAVNTSQARYVWLPIRFEGDRPRIDWMPEWRIEDFN
ncbi:MAG: family 43 glycosylhydrolase [Rhizorhabdus sp.]